MAVTARLRAVVEPIVADIGCDLYDLDHNGGVVRVTLDKPGGVDLETIALCSRLLSRELDNVDPIASKYTLEVTSPGLERPLRTADHYTRVIGWNVAIRTHGHVEGERRVQGVLVSADSKGVTVATQTPQHVAFERRLAYGDIERARTVFEWGATTVANSAAPKSKANIRTASKTGRASNPSFAEQLEAEMTPDQNLEFHDTTTEDDRRAS